ncbi:large subunit ribosomal protein L9 [Candidatus Hakubella thermalkaliphila]|uniref:Large ribosomal subunit protein bL9 n=1 Tax=Candidatus Hakubella thermalkaliphila TaxID=2754717 RepID=A0A6V8PQN0_9ACTN|nr:50S ribosomal protein L9 [Candidatus Hakubella thermalkaliphila]GFP34370.1 large subunit ribosomal protein L9 [Candidatus Hakubella thermalkaliphila]
MKVILKEDVESLGMMGDVLEVKDGYALNFLIPKKLALSATRGNLKQAEVLKRIRLKGEAKRREDALEQARAVADLVLEMEARAGEEGKLFGSITAKDIAEEIARKVNIMVDKKHIRLESPIKQTGEHDVEINFYADVSATVKVRVRGEEAKKEKAEEKKEQ